MRQFNRQLKKLWEIAKVFSWSAAPQWQENFENGKVPFIRTSDLGQLVDQIYLTSTRDLVNQQCIDSHKFVKALKGTIILPKSWASILTNKKAILGIDGYLVSHLAWIYVENKVTTKYLFYLFLRINILELSENEAYPSLKLSDIAQIQILLPPLEEQKKIVAYLDELNATISKLKSEYQSQLAMLDEMRNSSLELTLWGSRERARAYNLNNWKWVKLGGIAKTQSGGTPSRSNPLYRWEGIVRLKSWELEDNDCITKYTETITLLGLENSSAKKFTKGTLLLAMYGATAWKLGILWIDAATNQAVCAIQNTQNKFVEKYIYYFLLKERDKIIRDSFWWAQPNISKTYIDNIELPLPDLETQSQIVSHLDQVHQQITMLKTQVNSQIERCDELWQSSLEKVLTQGVE